MKLLLRQLPTGAASRKKGSGTVGASWFWLGTLSSKIWAFWGCYGAVRDAESDVGAALGIGHVEAGPLTRSSYHARQAAQATRAAGGPVPVALSVGR